MMAKTESRGLLSDEFKNILDNVLTENKEKRFFWDDVQNSFAPYEFNKLIGKLNPQFKKYEANDAKDLIIYLLQEMHEELNYFGGKKSSSGGLSGGAIAGIVIASVAALCAVVFSFILCKAPTKPPSSNVNTLEMMSSTNKINSPA